MQARIKSTNTTPRRPTRARRGNVIILAVAVLAVLAISAASYVTITRLDRSSAAAYSRRTGFIQQRDAALGHIRALLAADLFGNKIVETSTPRTDNQGASIWPAMFEDGEHWDIPWALAFPYGNQRNTWDQRTSQQKQDRQPVTPRARLGVIGAGAEIYYEAGWPDDAWLASTEPVNATPAAGARWDTWPQLTNLRSEYRYNREDEWWERADGRFVDLGRFFLSDDATRLRRGDPGADLTILEQDAVNTRPGAGSNIPGVGSAAEQFAGPLAMVEQPVYHLQMAQLEEARQDGEYAGYNPDAYDPSVQPFEMVDTRFFADTDGDGRPDARWQEIDVLGTSKGLRWVAAARIIDASSMVNANASLEWGDPGDSDGVGAGTTPADIDLRRLIETASRTTALDAQMRHPDINGIAQSAFTAHFNEHLTTGLNLGAFATGSTPDERDSKVFPELQAQFNLGLGDPVADWRDEYNRRRLGDWRTGVDGQFQPNSPTDPTTRLTRAQKEAHYRFVGSSLDRSSLLFRAGYDWKDNEVDLRAFWGFNYDTSVSPIEQRFDGPDGSGFSRLPGSNPPYPDSLSLGPLRSKEALEMVRTFGDSATLPTPATPLSQEEKLERIEKDVRRLLTTYNGSGFISPQPGWSRAGSEERPDATVELNSELRLSSVEEYERQMGDFLQSSFGAFMWALAPFATDRPPMRAGAIGSGGDLSGVPVATAYYGGWPNGPAEAESDAYGAVNPGETRAVYPARISAALAVNLADAMDNEGLLPTPTVMQVLKTYDIGLAKRSGTTTIGAPMLANAEANGIIEVGVDFRHGSVPIDAPQGPAGTDLLPEPFFNRVTGMTVVGLDRQVFLREAAAVSVYWKEETPPIANSEIIVDPTDAATHVGAILAVEVGNPFPDPIDISEYSFIFTNGADQVQLSLSDITDGNPIVDPGDVAVIYYATQTSPNPDLWDAALGEWLSIIGAKTANLIELGQVDDGENDEMFFEDFRGGPAATVLMVNNMLSAPLIGPVLLDRLHAAPGDTGFPFAQSDPVSVGLIGAIDQATLSGASGVNVFGAFSDASSLSRPSESFSGTGFPAYVIERAELNVIEQSDAETSAGAGEAGEEPAVGALVIGPEGNRLGEAKDIFPELAPSFQLFVPDGPLLSPAELLRLSIYAHVFQPVIKTPTPVTVDPIADAAYPYESNTATLWRTVSEQLGSDSGLAYRNDGQAPSPGTNVDPFFGVLDFSRGVPGVDLSGYNADVPNELRVPLALRVVDAFETLGSLGTLAQGRININTAPDRVLRLLPLVDPRDESSSPAYGNGAMLAGWTADISRSNDRLNLLMDYRSAVSNLRSPIDGSLLNRTPEQMTNLNGLREIDATSQAPAVGIVSMGEVAAMHQWDANSGLPASASQGAFAELGADGAAQPAPTIDGAGAEAALDIRVTTEDVISGNLFDGQDDLEERLAIFRAVSQVASNRSDVYIAWFIIRGYEPATIESIEIPGADIGSDDLRAQLLNQLQPAHESRWLAVLDRSKVRQPTDRPEIVLLVELPSTSP
jgi:hypothetical protein